MMIATTPTANGVRRSGWKQDIAVTDEQMVAFKAAARAMWREQQLEPIMIFLAGYFQVDPPSLEVGPQYSNCYDPTTRTIYIDKHSVVSLLHEFWHHARGSSEEGARTFSVSLYAKAFPNLYAQMVAQNRLFWY